MRDLRLLLPAMFAWLAGWCALGITGGASSAALVAWALWAAAFLAVGLAVMGVLRERRRPAAGGAGAVGAPFVRAAATALVVISGGALVASSVALGLGARESSPLADAAQEHRTAEVTIELTGAPRVMRTNWFAEGEAPPLRVDGRLVGIDGAAAHAVPVTTALSLPAGELQLGARVTFSARVTALPAEEGAAFRLAPVGDIRSVTLPPPWLAWTVGLRTGFAETAGALGGDGGALVPGLAIGDTSAVDEGLDTAMKAASLSHLTAVSGANCAIVTAAAFALAALLGLPRLLRVVVALAALAGFVVLVTPEASVVRAATMAVVVLVAVAAGRPGGGTAALSLAVVVLLVADPWYARDYGFALSVFATAGLLLLARPLTVALARWMPLPVAAVIGVPLAAQLACQPVLVLLDPALALYGVPANLLAAPAAPVGTVVGLIGCLLLPVLPSVGFACLQLAWLPASWIALLARASSAMPAARLEWLPDAPGALLLAACTAIALWLLLGSRRRRRVRGVAAAVLIVAIAVPVGLFAGRPLIGAATRPLDWDVAACDIGQGDAVLLRSAEATALIDTGPDPAALSRCLTLLGITRIDLLVLTHWDADHAGGVSAVAGLVDTVLHGPLDGDRSTRALDPLVAAGAESVEVVAGFGGTLGDARWRVVWPRPDAPPGNDASVVLDVSTPEYRGLFLGDLGEEAQARMLRSATLGPVDLVKVAHHGSADQSERLYDELGATVGVIGVGADNGYGHPTDRLLDLLRANGTAVVRTDTSGTALLTTDGGGFDLWTERSAVEQ
ncbi:ComEC/Rec2 family competence protein [Agromyces cerinus]|uniref:Competence protein ComEC n=1 Tax=Agromyces cerinus subsp. cerinus TaxID=232089 RepID=A0A1N6E4T7_9MICO|nr:ComEC/Rec2 family competence protein [Agromyces cerinus]SIN78042.1 competence protein ComEC [Agromyces cerinus subsp. cerinus]